MRYGRHRISRDWYRNLRTVTQTALCLTLQREVERVKGIEPSSQAWEARVLPLNHTRISVRN